jgi:hypothetical protein
VSPMPKQSSSATGPNASASRQGGSARRDGLAALRRTRLRRRTRLVVPARVGRHQRIQARGLRSHAHRGGRCGTPVVATRIPGHLDAVDDGYSGLLVANMAEMATRSWRCSPIPRGAMPSAPAH